MDDHLWMLAFQKFENKPVICEITDHHADCLAGNLVPCPYSNVQWRNGNQGLDAPLHFPFARQKIIYDGHLVAFSREVHRSWPAEISIPAQYENSLSHPYLPASNSRHNRTYCREIDLSSFPAASGGLH